MEKYVVPGAVAVGVLFLLPWYLLGGSTIGGSFDLATVVIAALVLGHVIESLKVYEWGSKVRKNRDRLNLLTTGLLRAEGLKENGLPGAPFEEVMRSVLTLVSAGRRSEFTWNLVRWQKMVVVATLLRLAAIEWLLMAGLCGLERYGANPFSSTWNIVFFKAGEQPSASLIAEGVLALILWSAAALIYRFGVNRQMKTNDFLFDLMIQYKEGIVELLREVGDSKLRKT